jgi:hypothetical protein
MKENYEALSQKVRAMQKEGKLPVWPTDEQRADWAFGNTVIEDGRVTLKMAQDAAAMKPGPEK